MFLHTLTLAVLSGSLLMPGLRATTDQPVEPTLNIVETAATAGSFNTLVEAIKVAGLVEVLSSEGPFTVFAPTDEAFSRIPQEELNGLIADKEALTAVLTYHVVPGKVYAEEVVKLSSAETVSGQTVEVRIDGGKVRIDGATVISADIEATNGVIHVIDRVILPDM